MSEKNKTRSIPAFHGSDIEKISEYFRIPKEKIVKFGANVNPLGLSDSLKKRLADNLDIITEYPDRDYVSLRKVIADYCKVDMDHVVTGNGSTELISLLISHRNAKHALLIGPTYSEYERELSLNGGVISEYQLNETDNFQLNIDHLFQSISEDIDFIILCNPNNPTSSAIHKKELTTLLHIAKEKNIFVMIDETYVEFAPDINEISAMSLVKQFDNVMIIRGVSKFYSAPGLRLGYGVTSNESFLKTLKTYQNPWSLNSIASLAGEIMLQDHEFFQKTRSLILSEREHMINELKLLKYAKTYPAYANFILIRILKENLTSYDVFEAAVKQGMMIRDCSSFKGLDGEYIRFCIMNPEDNKRLLNCLQELLND